MTLAMIATTLDPVAAPPRLPHAPRLLTAEEFMDSYEDYTELEDGRIIEVPMPQQNHGRANGRLAQHLCNYCDAHDCGEVFTNDTFIVIRRNPDTVRGMDVAYVSFDRWPRDQRVEDGPIPVPPELVIEVRSPTDRTGAVQTKLQEYLKIGVAVVGIVDPKKRIITLHRDGCEPQVFTDADTLEMPDILPGFSLPVKRMFG
jgi:Uma2 family endonuclease